MTVFRKTRGTETAEVARALRAQVICETPAQPSPSGLRPGGELT
jgi:hypothetical protein